MVCPYDDEPFQSDSRTLRVVCWVWLVAGFNVMIGPHLSIPGDSSSPNELSLLPIGKTAKICYERQKESEIYLMASNICLLYMFTRYSRTWQKIKYVNKKDKRKLCVINTWSGRLSRNVIYGPWTECCNIWDKMGECSGIPVTKWVRRPCICDCYIWVVGLTSTCDLLYAPPPPKCIFKI